MAGTVLKRKEKNRGHKILCHHWTDGPGHEEGGNRPPFQWGLALDEFHRLDGLGPRRLCQKKKEKTGGKAENRMRGVRGGIRQPQFGVKVRLILNPISEGPS